VWFDSTSARSVRLDVTIQGVVDVALGTVLYLGDGLGK
jgi:hypothetical protein